MPDLPSDSSPNPNTPEARIAQAAGFASWFQSGRRIGSTRKQVLLALGALVVLSPFVVALLAWLFSLL